MTLILHPKPSLEAFIQTCTPLARIKALDDEFETRVDTISESLMRYQSEGNDETNLATFLRADPDFLGIILALTNLSQEKFLRILSAQRFANGDFAPEWGIEVIQRKLKVQTGFAAQIARLFLEGRHSRVLIDQVASFYLNQLSLPHNWHEIIQDRTVIENAIRRKLMGEYNDRKGDLIETLIRQELDRLTVIYGFSHDKGQVLLVGKEVDHVVPSKAEPYIMIMTSYMETTSSGQTARANEQSTMYLAVQNDNIRYGTRRILINFVDGAGWLARRSDLRKMHAGCDYVLNLKTLDQLEAIICKFLPERYFTRTPRPQVEG